MIVKDLRNSFNPVPKSGQEKIKQDSKKEHKQWQETQKEKPPAMTYFEAMAKEFVKEDSKKLAELGARLFRFKKAYESIDSKQNALKKKIEAIRYEI